MLSVFFRKNIPVAGLYKPMVSLPSPFQSPTSGMSPLLAGPNTKVVSAKPPASLLLRKNIEVVGLYKPMVSVPSPFQSPVSGT